MKVPFKVPMKVPLNVKIIPLNKKDPKTAILGLFRTYWVLSSRKYTLFGEPGQRLRDLKKYINPELKELNIYIIIYNIYPNIFAFLTTSLLRCTLTSLLPFSAALNLTIIIGFKYKIKCNLLPYVLVLTCQMLQF